MKHPRIQSGVPGPAGQPGFLLIAGPDEALDWDIQHEVASTSRQWLADRQAWWIAAPYLPTVRTILRRMNGSADGDPESATGPAPVDPGPVERPGFWARLRIRLRGAHQRV